MWLKLGLAIWTPAIKFSRKLVEKETAALCALFTPNSY